MEKINKKKHQEIIKITSKGEDYLKKRVHIINDNLQLKIRIPKNMVDMLLIDNLKDSFEFELVPTKEVFGLKGRLLKDEI